jgi:hypothetical protein
VSFDETHIEVVLVDGRAIRAPLAWFPRLENAQPDQLAAWSLIGGGVGIHWEVLDEDLSVKGLLAC